MGHWELEDNASNNANVPPKHGEVRSDGPACWFIDTDYNEESCLVRHAYFLGANDPYKALKTTLKAEANEEAWATLNSDTSRGFEAEVGVDAGQGDEGLYYLLKLIFVIFFGIV